MDSLYETLFPIPPSDIDLNNRLKASAIFRYIQASAAAHAERLELGYAALQQAGLFWVLSWVRVEFDELPGYNQQIKVSTWPHGRYKIFSLRDFLFAGSDGRSLARARSAWLPVDAETRRVTHLEKLPRPIPYLAERSALDAFPEKMSVSPQAAPVYQRAVRYSDLDINRHVNNARYVEFALDAYPVEFHRERRLRAIEVWFKAESRAGETLLIARAADDPLPGTDTVAALNPASGVTVFQARLTWG